MSRLVNKHELNTFLECENCGTQVAKKPWPEGWTMTGRSLRRIPEDTLGATFACWCPNCDHRLRENPRDIEILKKRQELMQPAADPSRAEQESQ